MVYAKIGDGTKIRTHTYTNPNWNMNEPTGGGEERMEQRHFYRQLVHPSWAPCAWREPSSATPSLLRERKPHDTVHCLGRRQQVTLKHWYLAEGCKLWYPPPRDSKISYDLVNTNQSLQRPFFQVGYYRTLPPHIRIFKIFLFWTIHSLNCDS
jgi:hypothetical protein